MTDIIPTPPEDPLDLSTADNLPDNSAPPSTPEPSPIEQKARTMGWVPKEEWSGDPDEWRSAREFVDRGSLFKKIEHLNAQRAEDRKVITEMGAHLAKVREMERVRVLAELQQQKADAFANNDFSRVVELDDRIAETRNTPVAPVVSNDPPLEVQQLHEAFLERNNWYGSDAKMTAFADKIAKGFRAMNPDATPQEVYEEAERETRERFRSNFTPTPSGNPVMGAPTTRSTHGKGPKKFTERDLSPFQLQVARRFVESGGAASVQEYVDQLAEMGELG